MRVNNGSKKREREYVTAISIDAGIITLIEPDGQIAYYRQRGIGSLNQAQHQILISMGLLNKNWKQAKELPKHYTISFEDEEIMGKARASFSLPPAMRQQKPKK